MKKIIYLWGLKKGGMAWSEKERQRTAVAFMN